VDRYDIYQQIAKRTNGDVYIGDCVIKGLNPTLEKRYASDGVRV